MAITCDPAFPPFIFLIWNALRIHMSSLCSGILLVIYSSKQVGIEVLEPITVLLIIRKSRKHKPQVTGVWLNKSLFVEDHKAICVISGKTVRKGSQDGEQDTEKSVL